MKLIYQISILLITLQCMPATSVYFDHKATRDLMWNILYNHDIIIEEIPAIVLYFAKRKANFHVPVKISVSGPKLTPLQAATQQSTNGDIIGEQFKIAMLAIEIINQR